MITLFMMLVIVLTNSAGDIFISRGMKQMGDVSALKPSSLLGVAVKAVLNPNFLLGVLCLAASFFSFLAVLTWADLSFVVPATSIVYAVTVIGARIFLKEEVNGLRWAGTILICFGVALVCLP
ncbi:MAG: EamA family transporter [Acidobacteriota bacterium]